MKVKETLENDMAREKWKQHSLYMELTKPELEARCRELNIPIHSSLLHEATQDQKRRFAIILASGTV